MKKILIFIFSIITLNVFAQDTKLDYSAAQMDSILNGTKKVDIPTHYNENGDKQILDIDVKIFADGILSKGSTPCIDSSWVLLDTMYHRSVNCGVQKSKIVQSQHDLRFVNGFIERGSDSNTNPNGSAFLHDSYSHLNGFSDNWIGTFGASRPIVKHYSNGTVEFSTDGNHSTDLSMHYTQGSMSIGMNNVYYYPYTFIVGKNNTATNDYNFINGISNTTNSLGCSSSGAYNEISSASSYSTLTGILQKLIGQSANSFSSGSGNTMTDSKSSFSSGELHDNIGDYQFTAGYDQRNNSYNGILLGLGNHFAWAGQTSHLYINTDYHLRLNRTTQGNVSAIQSSLVILKDGKTQINNDLNGNNSHLQSQTTPSCALDVVSTTAGFQSPRMTESELTTYLSTFNLTTDITGGANGNAYCKIGMEVICTNCTSLDGSTTGVKVNIYPNAAQTAWIAKKSH